jgi:NADH:ubiquinone oxidoreductase subunit C
MLILLKKRLKLIVLISYFIRLYLNFFRGFFSEFSLLWDSLNSFFLIRMNYNPSSGKMFNLLNMYLNCYTLSQMKSLVELTCSQSKQSMIVNNLNYILLSFRFNYRLQVSLFLNGYVPYIQSLTKIFYSANWLEREAWDLFGIIFKGHPDLRRILTDYGFKGHPLQKTFPLVGFLDIIYSDTEKRVIYIPLELTQAPRVFLPKLA